MQIEDIIQYSILTPPIPLLFQLREYSTQQGEYYMEVVTNPVILVSDPVSLIIETDTFSPCLSYKRGEVDRQFRRLNDKSRRAIKLIQEANQLFNNKYVRTKGDSGHNNPANN